MEYFPQKYFRSSLATFSHLQSRGPPHAGNLSTQRMKTLVTFYWQRRIENNSDSYNPIQFAYSLQTEEEPK